MNTEKHQQRETKYQTEVMVLNNTTTEVKNTLQGFNSRLGEMEERAVELTQSSKRKKEF